MQLDIGASRAEEDPRSRRSACSLFASRVKIDVGVSRTFFVKARHIHGRTALLLSGGAGLGMFHFGVVRELRRHGLLPRIISGAAAARRARMCMCACVRACVRACLRACVCACVRACVCSARPPAPCVMKDTELEKLQNCLQFVWS